MRISLIIATFLLINGDLLSQGGVDVKYIAIDTMDLSVLGVKVKIDFKSSDGPKPDLMQRAWYSDTVQLDIDNKTITVIEHKGTGVDYWYFDQEYLESFDYVAGQILIINEIEIVTINSDSIQFRITMEHFGKKRKKLERLSFETKNIWIPRNRIEGILIRGW